MVARGTAADGIHAAMSASQVSPVWSKPAQVVLGDYLTLFISVAICRLLQRRCMTKRTTTRATATAPSGIPTPRPILRLLLIVLAAVSVGSTEDVVDVNGCIAAGVVARLVVLVPEPPGADDEVAVAVAVVVAGVRVAPSGVSNELVATFVNSATDEPTRSEYSGRKSAMCCVLTPVVQLHAGPSTQQ